MKKGGFVDDLVLVCVGVLEFFEMGSCIVNVGYQDVVMLCNVPNCGLPVGKGLMPVN